MSIAMAVGDFGSCLRAVAALNPRQNYFLVAMDSDLPTSAAQPDRPDRITVRDTRREVEIGAFQIEQGVTQRLSFTVILEVAPPEGATGDDVDRVLSYDTIVQAIDEQLGVGRVNLLETLAERIAAQVLTDKRANRVSVRIDKLDRIDGSLGVEITRTREALRDVPANSGMQDTQPAVVFIPNTLLHSTALGDWLDAINGTNRPTVICVDTVPRDLPRSGDNMVNRHLALLSIEQNAWLLAGKDNRCTVVSSRTELDWALQHRHLTVWAPSQLVLNAANAPADHNNSALELARWLAGVLNAGAFFVALGDGAKGSDITLSTPAEIKA